MTDPLRIEKLTAAAQGLGFEVSCQGGTFPMDLEGPLGVRLQGNEVHFGGTVGECAAFLAGWGTLRSRLLGELRVVDAPEMSGQPQGSVLLPHPGTSSCGAPRGTAFGRRCSARRALVPDPCSSLRSGEGTAGDLALERSLSRDRRQAMIIAWAELAFGQEEATGLPQRGLRLLEEAIEVFQACGGAVEIAHELVTVMFERHCGTIGQALGGVAVSLLALAAASGLSADAEECREIHRVLSKPVEEFSRRNASKIKITSVIHSEML